MELTFKVYDLNSLFLKECGLQAFNYEKVMILEGERGVVIAEHEAVHKRLNSLDDEIQMDANSIPDKGMSYILPNYKISTTPRELMTAPYEEMTLDHFFDKKDYNPRCQDNYRILLQSLDAIGFPERIQKSYDLDSMISHTESLKQKHHKEQHQPEKNDMERNF